VVGTYDSTGTLATLYVNGTSNGTPGTVTLSKNTTRALGIGATDTGGTWAQFFTGTIDDVALYNTALTAAQIQLHYTSGAQ
jgi:hypothetical protein